jgi:hypothetical protein
LAPVRRVFVEGIALKGIDFVANETGDRHFQGPRWVEAMVVS